MTVVSNTTPLNYLLLIGRAEVLNAPYEIGEREAILLAEHIQADFIILDDRKARRIARDRRLNVVGTIGILTAGAKKGLINLGEALDDLKQTNFRASSELLELLVQQNRE